FRIAKLLDRLKALEPDVQGLDTRFVHFVDVERALTASEREVLERLLTYGPAVDRAADDRAGERLIVVPREGTISPWSSKATDIARVCGLDPVRRIERGITYSVLAAKPLGHERLAVIAPVLFDRMTETVLFDFADAERLFGHAQPRSL